MLIYSQDNLATVVFQQPPTAHAISQLTVGPERQDIVVGLETGDLVYLDFINDRTERFNAAVSGLSPFGFGVGSWGRTL